MPWKHVLRWHHTGRVLTGSDSPLLPYHGAIKLGPAGVAHPVLQRLVEAHPLTPWSADTEVLNVLMEEVRGRAVRRILEFGSGISTAALALACADAPGNAWRVLSIEQDEHHAGQARTLLREAGVEEHAGVVTAPLVPRELGGGTCRAYNLDAVPAGAWHPDQRADVLFVDGPSAGELSRAAAVIDGLQRADPGCLVFMDDSLRDTEIRVFRFLIEHGHVACDGVIPVGKGLGVAVGAARAEELR